MKGIRVTAGSLRGRKIHSPSADVRPTSSRAREAVFNILADEIAGARFLDLFAGSGIMSIEALSRGAGEAVAVDSSRRALAPLEQLAKSWGLSLSTTRDDVRRFLSRSRKLRAFDIVYVDPPYDFAHYDEIMQMIDTVLPLSENAVVVIEHRRKRKMSPADFERLHHRESRAWGEVSVEIFDARSRDRSWASMS